ncbi:MAG: hypothetical protein CVU84_10930 [Firmicutes bacterium HGW-Firmicutes-1]|jgi:rubrerythrin|nr:MAG: hypothetical protein CVU84_10930 [Firmicutes bacterium HGW-Firmicutes-1]
MENATLYEVLQLAVHLEEEGQKFYEKYAQKAKGDIKETFERLALDEVKHGKYFQSLYHEAKEKPGLDYLFEEEVTAYFKEYAVSAAFDREETKVMSVEEAVAEAILTEKKSIDYYKYLDKYALTETKGMINTIIQEEEKHLAVLEKLLEAM